MVEKRFELVGVSEMSIMYQGLIYPPKKRITLIVCESDKNFYSRFMVVESVKELSENKFDASKLENGGLPEIGNMFIQSEEETMAVEKPKPTPKPKTTTAKKKTTTTNKTKK